jgi:hypothetical protein
VADLARYHNLSDETTDREEWLEFLSRARPGWWKRAKCRTGGPSIDFFDETNPGPTLVVCQKCPVRRQCHVAGMTEKPSRPTY